MSKMNVEVMEQLLKDLAANVGYDLIPAPFDTSFEEASLDTLPDYKQFVWPVPASVLVDDVHKDLRKMLIDADLIDTVVELKLDWPHSKDDHMAILLLDVARSRSGCVKFVDATDFNLTDSEMMAGVCNMIIHDQYPGDDLLSFQVNGDVMDLWLSNPWNEQVSVVSAENIKTFLPGDYIVKYSTFLMGEHELLGELMDIYEPSELENGIKRTAIAISTRGKLSPMKIEPKDFSAIGSLKDKMILVPIKEYYNLDYVLESLTREEVVRQLPINRRIFKDDIWRVNIEVCEQFYLVSKEERDRIDMEELYDMDDLLSKGIKMEDILKNEL